MNNPMTNQARLPQLDPDQDAYVVREPDAYRVQFMTPERYARQMAQAAWLQPHHLVLEPCAGTGRLADAIALHVPKHQITLYEINPDFQNILVNKGYTIAGADFLAPRFRPMYDRIFLNPPFEEQDDLTLEAHFTLQAWTALRRGGTLVQVMSPAMYQALIVGGIANPWLPLLNDIAEIRPIPIPETIYTSNGLTVNAHTLALRKRS